MKNWSVFISYSHKDRTLVAPITSLMRIPGNRVFRDEDSIHPGKQWRLTIAETLRNAKTVVVFWSFNSSESAFVREEYTAAIQLGKDVVPVLLDQTPLIAELARFQCLDFRPLIRVSKITSEFMPTAGGVGSVFTGAGWLLGALLGSVVGAVYYMNNADACSPDKAASQLTQTIRDNFTPHQLDEFANAIHEFIAKTQCEN